MLKVILLNTQDNYKNMATEIIESKNEVIGNFTLEWIDDYTVKIKSVNPITKEIDKDNNIIKLIFGDKEPIEVNEMFYDYLIKKIEMINDNEFIIYAEDKKQLM